MNIQIPPLFYIYIFFFFFKLFFYFWLHWVFIDVQAFSSCNEQGLLSSCSTRASHCNGFCCCRACVLGRAGSVVVAHRLSCPMACEIFLDQGSKSWPLRWQVGSLSLCHLGSLSNCSASIKRKPFPSPVLWLSCRYSLYRLGKINAWFF